MLVEADATSGYQPMCSNIPLNTGKLREYRYKYRYIGHYTGLNAICFVTYRNVNDGSRPAAQPPSRMARSSFPVSSRPVAAMFSAACSGEPVPGIGSIAGERESPHASTTWDPVAPSRRAAFSTPTFFPACLIGAHGRNTSDSCSQTSSTACEERSVTLNRFCTETTLTIPCASRSCSSDTFDTPTCLIFPSFWSSATAPMDSE